MSKCRNRQSAIPADGDTCLLGDCIFVACLPYPHCPNTGNGTRAPLCKPRPQPCAPPCDSSRSTAARLQGCPRATQSKRDDDTKSCESVWGWAERNARSPRTVVHPRAQGPRAHVQLTSLTISMVKEGSTSISFSSWLTVRTSILMNL